MLPKTKVGLVILFLTLQVVILWSVSPANAQDQPSFIVTDWVICKDVDSTLRPVDPAYGFLDSDRWVYTWFEGIFTVDRQKPVTFAARWFDPNGSPHTWPGEKGLPESELVFTWSWNTTRRWTSWVGVPVKGLVSKPGVWRFELYADGSRILTEHFTVGKYLVNVSVVGLLGEFGFTNVSIDGTPAGTLGFDRTIRAYALTGGDHVISVEEYVYATSSARFHASPSQMKVSLPGDAKYEFNYIQELYLNITAPKGILLDGSGWYAYLTNVSFRAPPVVTVNDEERLVFTRWSGDYSGTNPEGLIVMDEPKAIVANYVSQFSLTVVSEHGEPRGGGWYNGGAVAVFSVDREVPMEGLLGLFGGMHVFNAWEGDVTAKEVAAEVSVTRPIIVRASWTPNYSPVALRIAIMMILALGVLLVVRRKKRLPTLRPPPETKYCISCGSIISEDSDYCMVCGAKQPELPEPRQDYSASRQAL